MTLKPDVRKTRNQSKGLHRKRKIESVSEVSEEKRPRVEQGIALILIAPNCICHSWCHRPRRTEDKKQKTWFLWCNLLSLKGQSVSVGAGTNLCAVRCKNSGNFFVGTITFLSLAGELRLDLMNSTAVPIDRAIDIFSSAYVSWLFVPYCWGNTES
jgi:hypothetical protein